MRKFLISAALAASAFVAAAPAAAQWAPPPPNGYGYGYGHNNYGQVRRLEARIDGVQRKINRLDKRDRLSEREARFLRAESRDVEDRLHYAARNGLSGWERNDIERRIYRLEARVQREAHDGNGHPYYQAGYDNDGWNDRDRDGRNDRFEDDRGRDHDGRGDRDND